MIRALLLAAALYATPAYAQHAAAPAASPAVEDPACPAEHAAMGHCTPSAPTPPPVDDPSCPAEHAAMGHCTPAAKPATGAPPVAPPSAAARSGPEYAADTIWNPQEMAAVRRAIYAEHGGFTGSRILIDRLEYRAAHGQDGYAWEGDAWFGGDYDRLWLKTEGEGSFGEGLESAEIQALYSRAIDPWFNLQAGVRYDLRPRPDRTHLALGVQGLAPYWFEIDVATFLSDRGDLTAAIEAEYDLRLTNRLILQPRIEIELSAQDIPAIGQGAGLSSIEAGLRLRYEIVPEFAPYIGVDYGRSLGDTADFARAGGEDTGGWAFLTGIRLWF